MNEHGPLRGRRVAGHARCGDGIYFLESDVNELAQAKGANVAGLQMVFRHVRHRRSTTSTSSTWPAASAGTSASTRRSASADSEICRTIEDRAGRQRRDRRRDASRCCRGRSARAGGAGEARRALPARNASALLRFLRRRLPVQAGLGVVARRTLASPSRRPRDDRARRHPAGGAGRAGRVQAAARLSARARARRPGRGAGRPRPRPGTPSTAGRGSTPARHRR